MHTLSFLSPFLILMAVASAAVAADWQDIGQDANDDKIFYRLERKIDSRVEVWGKRIFSEKGAKEFLRDSRDNGMDTTGWRSPGHFVSFYEIDCRENMSRVLSVVIYAADGGVIYASSFGRPPWEYIPRGSIGELFRKKVCPQ